MLAIASGVTMLHGPLLRHLTTGQLPVTALMSSDNGKAQVEYLAIFFRSRESRVMTQGKSETAKGLLWAFSTLDNKFSCNIHISTMLKVFVIVLPSQKLLYVIQR